MNMFIYSTYQVAYMTHILLHVFNMYVQYLDTGWSEYPISCTFKFFPFNFLFTPIWRCVDPLMQASRIPGTRPRRGQLVYEA